MSQPAGRPDLNPAQPGGLRVLVVDDERALADLVGSYLTRDGFEVSMARRQLVDAVWDESWVGDEHLVDVHVGHLRRKLGDDPSSPRYVGTVRGVGYRMGDGT